MNQTLAGRRGLWHIVLWLGMVLEGLWFFVAFTLAPAPYPYQLLLLLLLWALVVLCVLAFKQRPLVAFFAACNNLVGMCSAQEPSGGRCSPVALVRLLPFDRRVDRHSDLCNLAATKKRSL